MDIPTCRFVDQKRIEEFKCSNCDDVAANPVTLNGCKHIFCKSCIELSDNLTKCPSCQAPVVKAEKPWKNIDGYQKYLYLATKVKCLNPTCTRVLNVKNYKNHDDNCPVTFKMCDDCGRKRRRVGDLTHSCAKGLKDDYNKKLEQLDDKMDKKLEQLDDKIDKKLTCLGDKMGKRIDRTNELFAVVGFLFIGIVFIWAFSFAVGSKFREDKLRDHFETEINKLRSELIIGIKDLVMTERIRYENLVASSLSFRSEYANRWSYDPMGVHVIVSRDGNAKSVKALHKLTSTIDDAMKIQDKQAPN